MSQLFICDECGENAPESDLVECVEYDDRHHCADCVKRGNCGPCRDQDAYENSMDRYGFAMRARGQL